MLQSVPGADAAEVPAAAAKAEAGGTGPSLWGRIVVPVREFHEHLASDQSFADHVGRLLDFWTAVLCFLVYTGTAVLIFVVNGALFD